MGTSYHVADIMTTGKTMSFTIAHDSSSCQALVPKNGGPPESCCQMAIDKIEMVINPECYGEVQSILVNDLLTYPTYSNVTYINQPEAMPAPYPAPQPWYQTFKITQLEKHTGGITVSINFRTEECSASENFFLNGLLWFSYFNS
eukprot:gene31597-6792_t